MDVGFLTRRCCGSNQAIGEGEGRARLPQRADLPQVRQRDLHDELMALLRARVVVVQVVVGDELILAEVVGQVGQRYGLVRAEGGDLRARGTCAIE